MGVGIPGFGPARGLVLVWLLSGPVPQLEQIAGAGQDSQAEEQKSPIKGEGSHVKEDEERLTDEYIPLQKLPKRPFTLDSRFPWDADWLPTGFLKPGRTGPEFELPTGAVWQPSVIVFGTYRTALQTFDDGQTKFAEWANRLDLFAEVRVTGTERLLVGIRPLDEDGRFTQFNFQPQADSDWQTAFNVDLTTLFVEGDISEIFPNLDPEDRYPFDLGFAVGRQPVLIQEGMLINDTFDAVGLVKNNLLLPGTSNWRTTFLYGWAEIDRGNNFSGNSIADGTAQLWGLFNEIDTPFSTINLDFGYVHSRRTGDAFYAGVSAVQRIGHLNTSLRANASFPTTGENDLIPTSAEDLERDRREVAQNTRGYLFFGEASWTPPHTHDIVYFNGFWAVDRFSSAARGPTTGGPLGRTGILFSAIGLGRFGSPLSNQSEDALGAALGYQKFLDHDQREQVVVEIGGRKNTNGIHEGSVGLGARYQHAFGQHVTLQVDVFGAAHEHLNASYGARIEFRFQF